MNHSCLTCVSQVTHERVMSHVHGAHDAWRSQVKYGQRNHGRRRGIKSLQPIAFGVNDISFGVNDISFGVNDISFGVNDISFGVKDISFGVKDISFRLSQMSIDNLAHVPRSVEKGPMGLRLEIYSDLLS